MQIPKTKENEENDGKDKDKEERNRRSRKETNIQTNNELTKQTHKHS